MSPMQPGQNSIAVSGAVMNAGPNNPGTGSVNQQAPSPAMAGIPGILSPATALDHYRLSQLYQYAMAAERLRCPQNGGAAAAAAAFFPTLRPELAPFLYNPYCRFDTRLALCRPPEEPKPQHSYIGLIAMAILSSQDNKLVLSDIYQYILDNYAYFRSRGPGWRNSIRHNLSLNDCFIKAGRSANGKGHYWAIHPANMDDFQKGDFRRRKAQRKVRRHMGLAVDDEDSPSPPPSTTPPPPINWPDHAHAHAHGHLHPPPPHHLNPHFPSLVTHPTFGMPGLGSTPADFFSRRQITAESAHAQNVLAAAAAAANSTPILSHHHRKRQFDVASLLAPEKFEREDKYEREDSGRSEDEREHRNLSPPTLIPLRIKSPDSNLEEGEEADDEMDAEQIDVDEELESPHLKAKSDVQVKSEQVTSEDESAGETETKDGASTPAKIPRNRNGNGGNSKPLVSMSALDFHCQQHQQQQQQSIAMQQHHHHQHAHLPGFHLSPSHLLHNPSLASLMILSSKYRELTSNMNSGNPPGGGSGGSVNLPPNNSKRHPQ